MFRQRKPSSIHLFMQIAQVGGNDLLQRLRNNSGDVVVFSQQCFKRRKGRPRCFRRMSAYVPILSVRPRPESLRIVFRSVPVRRVIALIDRNSRFSSCHATIFSGLMIRFGPPSAKIICSRLTEAPKKVHMNAREMKRLPASFFRKDNGSEPVRDWLPGLGAENRKTIGVAINTVECSYQ